jgi:leucyl/phenylalanyl-tRNA--protein transferase
MLPWLDVHTPFPPIERALKEPSGLLAAGADLSVPRLLNAYQHGIFPWYSEGEPILWWSTEPRMVLRCADFHCHRSLRKTLQKISLDPAWEIRCDTAFAEVIQACSEQPRAGQSGTWIVPEMVAAYCALHHAGHAHSVETWHEGKLVAGLYGVAIGRMFYGESMFTRVTDGSKIALAALVAFLRTQDCALIDCQQQTRHLASLGAAPISRAAFKAHLASSTVQPAMDWSSAVKHSNLKAILTVFRP